jgi:hypothetical protein
MAVGGQSLQGKFSATVIMKASRLILSKRDNRGFAITNFPSN